MGSRPRKYRNRGKGNDEEKTGPKPTSGISEEKRAQLRAMPKDMRTTNKKKPAKGDLLRRVLNASKVQKTGKHVRPMKHSYTRKRMSFHHALAWTSKVQGFPMAEDMADLEAMGTPTLMAQFALWGDGVAAFLAGEDLGEVDSEEEDDDEDEEEGKEDDEMEEDEDDDDDDEMGDWDAGGGGSGGSGGMGGSGGGSGFSGVGDALVVASGGASGFRSFSLPLRSR